MNLVDFLVLIIVILLISVIVFFSFIFPRIRGQKSSCSSCPTVKRAKRLVKDYKNIK